MQCVQVRLWPNFSFKRTDIETTRRNEKKKKKKTVRRNRLRCQRTRNSDTRIRRRPRWVINYETLHSMSDLNLEGFLSDFFLVDRVSWRGRIRVVSRLEAFSRIESRGSLILTRDDIVRNRYRVISAFSGVIISRKISRSK